MVDRCLKSQIEHKLRFELVFCEGTTVPLFALCTNYFPVEGLEEDEARLSEILGIKPKWYVDEDEWMWSGLDSCSRTCHRCKAFEVISQWPSELPACLKPTKYREVAKQAPGLDKPLPQLEVRGVRLDPPTMHWGFPISHLSMIKMATDQLGYVPSPNKDEEDSEDEDEGKEFISLRDGKPIDMVERYLKSQIQHDLRFELVFCEETTVPLFARTIILSKGLVGDEARLSEILGIKPKWYVDEEYWMWTRARHSTLFMK